MKNLLCLLLLFIGFAFNQVKAQANLQPEVWAAEYVSVSAGDTVGAATVTTWNRGWMLNKGDALFYNAKVKVSDHIAGAGCSVVMQGKYFAGDAYVNIGSALVWSGSGTDTTFTFTSNTNKVYYRYLNFLVTRTTGVAAIDYVKLSLKK